MFARLRTVLPTMISELKKINQSIQGNVAGPYQAAGLFQIFFLLNRMIIKINFLLLQTLN